MARPNSGAQISSRGEARGCDATASPLTSCQPRLRPRPCGSGLSVRDLCRSGCVSHVCAVQLCVGCSAVHQDCTRRRGVGGSCVDHAGNCSGRSSIADPDDIKIEPPLWCRFGLCRVWRNHRPVEPGVPLRDARSRAATLTASPSPTAGSASAGADDGTARRVSRTGHFVG